MLLAPIILFVYNRADHFRQTFEALTHCPEAADSELFIFSDGAKNTAAADKVQEVRETARALAKTGSFRQVHLQESPENRGLAASVIAGVTEVLARHGRAIVLEDDCLASPHLLHYMNACLNYYKQNPAIGAIAGYAPEIPFPDDYPHDVFLAYRSCSCSWATWQDRWLDVDWDLRDMATFYRHPSLISRLNANGSDRFPRLYRQTKGNGSSWSVRFGAHLVKKNWLTVYPRYSYIQNIGCDASGVHSKAEDAAAMRVDMSKALPAPSIENVLLNRDIQAAMKRHYSRGWLSDCKRFLASYAIFLKERIKLISIRQSASEQQ